MADKQELIIEISVSDQASKINGLKADMADLIKQREELTEKSKAGDAEAAKALQNVSSQIRNLQQETRAQERVLDGYNASVKKGIDLKKLENNSLNENRALIKQLTAQYADLRNPLEKDTQLLNNLAEVLKKQESAIGNNARNVGNYKEAITSAFSELKGIGGVVDPIKNIGLAFQSAGGGVKGFGAALATTGLPLFISGMNLLIDAFSTFEPLADAVEDIMAGLSSAFTSSYAEGVKLARLKRELEDTDREAIITNAELKKSINELEAQADNKAARDEDRIAKLKEANAQRIKQIEIDRKSAQISKEIADKEAEESKAANNKKAGILRAILPVLGEVENEASDDALKRQAEAQARLIELDDQFNQQIIANQNKIDRLTKNIQEDRDRQLADSKSKRDKLNAEAERDQQRELNNLKQIAIEQEKMRVDNIAALDREITEAKKLNDQARVDELQAEKDFAEKQKTQAAEYLKEQEQLAQAEIKIEANKQKEKETLTQAGFAFATNLISMIGSALKDASDSEIEADRDRSEKAKDALQKQLDSGVISKEKYNAEIEAIDSEFRKKESAEKKKQWDIAKGIQIVNTIITTAQAVVAGLNAGFSLGPAGVVTGPVLAALAAATGVAQLAIISAQQPPKFASGVIGLDGAGSETSDSIDAKLSRGESVMTARATRKYHRQLAWMEQSVGNIPNYQFGKGAFANGFIPSIVTGDGGYVARDIARQRETGITLDMIRAAISSIPPQRLDVGEFNKVDSRVNRAVQTSEL